MKTENYEHEDLIPECIEIIKTEQRASVSLLQRRLRLGYIRAASIMDELEKRGIENILTDWIRRMTHVAFSTNMPHRTQI